MADSWLLAGGRVTDADARPSMSKCPGDRHSEGEGALATAGESPALRSPSAARMLAS